MYVYIYIVHAYYLSRYLSIHIYLFFYRSIYILWVYDIWPADCKVYLLDILLLSGSLHGSRRRREARRALESWRRLGTGPKRDAVPRKLFGDGKKWENIWENVGKTMEFMGKLGNPQENGASTGKSWDKLGNIWKTCGDDANDMEWTFGLNQKIYGQNRIKSEWIYSR